MFPYKGSIRYRLELSGRDLGRFGKRLFCLIAMTSQIGLSLPEKYNVCHIVQIKEAKHSHEIHGGLPLH